MRMAERVEKVLLALRLLMDATRASMEVVTSKHFLLRLKALCLSQVRFQTIKSISGDTFDILVAFNGGAYAINKKNLRRKIMVYDFPAEI